MSTDCEGHSLQMDGSAFAIQGRQEMKVPDKLLSSWDGTIIYPPSLQEDCQEVPLAGSRVLTVTTGCLTDQHFEEDEDNDDPCCGCTRKENQIQAPMASYKIGMDLQVTGSNTTTWHPASERAGM